MSRFENSSFHREGRGKPAPVTPPRPKESDFIKELRETGRANWKKAPKEVKTRYRGIYLIMFSIPLIVIPSYELWRRLTGRSVKKIQQGELLEGQQIRHFDEDEKWEVEKNSILYKIFGHDFFQDGFTSKTMKKHNWKKDDE